MHCLIRCWTRADLVYTGERKLLSDVPNALSYERILETSTSGYLVRQYIHSSLYDRMRYV
jgi:phosphoinositide-3-kinase regulatory subunit 4